MATNSFLERGVDLQKLAELTKNFSGAEIEGLVKDAVAYALNRNVDFNDLQKPLDEEDIKVGRAAGAVPSASLHTCWPWVFLRTNPASALSGSAAAPFLVTGPPSHPIA